MTESIYNNFAFLTAETLNQVKLTRRLVASYDPKILEKITTKDDYIDNLKTNIENACFSRILNQQNLPAKSVRNDIRAVHIMCVNLERIADYCVNISRQLQHLSDQGVIRMFDYEEMFDEAEKGLSKIAKAREKRDLSVALDICRTEFNLDEHYKRNFDRILKMLQSRERTVQATDLVTTIFIIRYLERIGDSLLNIGEAMIFSICGDRIKIRHYDAIEKTLQGSQTFYSHFHDIDFSSILGSRSGCRIGKVEEHHVPASAIADDLPPQEHTHKEGIFKEGDIKKIRQEKENIERWHNLFPGIAPEILGYHESEKTASMLIQFLSGYTLDQIVLTESPDMIRRAIYIFEQTIDAVWEKSLREGPVATDYIAQLKSRLDSVYQVHPKLKRPRKMVGGQDIPATHDLIQACEQIEEELPAPFTILLHGDFNTNNVVYNVGEQKVHYIDLYRSREADYVQDASVFLVSYFRLPVHSADLRYKINQVIDHFGNYFLEFARRHDDKTYQARMALALARSLFTSARFELDEEFATDMCLRSHYLMEQVAEYEGKPWEEFTLPSNILSS